MNDGLLGCDIGADIGGTFTDIVCRQKGGIRTLKIPISRGDPSEAVLVALTQLRRAFGLDPAIIARFLHGTTIATNAVLECKGARIGLITSHGFREVLEIGFQLRRDLYRVILEPGAPVFLAPGAFRREVPEQVSARGDVLVPLDEDAVRRATPTATPATPETHPGTTAATTRRYDTKKVGETEQWG